MTEQAEILKGGKAVYINLDRRTDRRAHIEAELERIGLAAERLPGTPHSFGILGCGLSHLAALKLARDSGWPCVLILEDDFQAEVEPAAFWGALKKFGLRHGSDFDVAMLAYHVTASEPCDDIVVRVKEAQTASAYLVNAPAYDPLIELLEEAMRMLEKTGEHWNWANDQIWKRLQPEMRWYAFKPRLGKQIASWSDTANEFHDYNV